MRRKAIKRETVMVQRIIGRDCWPVFRTTVRSNPNPSRITAH